MAQQWSLSYRVSELQDRITRYNEVKSAVTIPPECANDEAQVHVLTEQLITDTGEPGKPYAIYTSGTRDAQGYTVMVKLDPNA